MKKILLILVLILSKNMYSQHGGNQIYRNSRNYDRFVPQSISNFISTDSTVVFTANILLNEKADLYKITFGVNEEKVTLKEANEGINKRINSFEKKLSSLGIKKENIFIDFISQTKIYDFDIDESSKSSVQKFTGFEVKKNIIITLSDYSKIEDIISEASNFEIFDIIKVDYMNNDIEKIKQQLSNEAQNVIDSKQKKYFTAYKREIIGEPRANESFYAAHPKNQYQEYSAFESSEISSYNSNNHIKKLERKSKTFYYEGVDYSIFDKVLNQANPEIGIQYILNLIVTYDVKKNK